MCAWGVVLGLKAICWRCPACSSTMSLLSHKNHQSVSFPRMFSNFTAPLPVTLFLSLLTFTNCASVCVLWVSGKKTGTQLRSEEQGLNRNTNFGPFLISNGKPAVTTPPAYKCTCRSQSLILYNVSLLYKRLRRQHLQPSALQQVITSAPNQILLNWEYTRLMELLFLKSYFQLQCYCNYVTVLQGILLIKTKHQICCSRV